MSQDIIQILRDLYPGFDPEPLLKSAGGRQWYLPTIGGYRVTLRYRAILQFPSRDYKEVAAHFRCSPGVVYRAWKSNAA